MKHKVLLFLVVAFLGACASTPESKKAEEQAGVTSGGAATYKPNTVENNAAPDQPCVDSNQFGAHAKGGGCNMYGCWPAGGYCNGFGCSLQGTCTNKGCPRPIDSYRCRAMD